MSLKWFGCLIVLSIFHSGSLWARAEASAGHTLYLVESHQLPLCEEDQTGDTIPQRRRVHDHAGELTHATQQHFHCHLFLCHTKQFYAIQTYQVKVFPPLVLMHSVHPHIFFPGLPRAGEYSRFQLGVWLRSLRSQRRFQGAARPSVAPCCSPPFH